ncbi:hypothetical protein CIB48_g7724 [Xylaria polymorpha]|nr:hypothetical protein CIB48_g7724 [Xylaria polymorpha]
MAAPESRLGKSQPFTRERRVTKDGRQLWYQLEVLQQPERARACGSGPKSSADRRPVDPPPVVILRVSEGETFEGARDITFDYNVDFFLLCLARTRPPDGSRKGANTRSHVASLFSLYELIKNEGDLDRDAPEPESGSAQLPTDACHRMDLRSADFTVFSAKKFPGLTESTTLSRTVAEQGCRVRIRRDVRMRRRDTNAKPAGGDEYNNNNAEEEYAKRRGTQTPEGYRARSMSNSSMDRTSFSDRRPSTVDYTTAPPPPGYQTSKPSGALLNFGPKFYSYLPPLYMRLLTIVIHAYKLENTNK